MNFDKASLWENLRLCTDWLKSLDYRITSFGLYWIGKGPLQEGKQALAHMFCEAFLQRVRFEMNLGVVEPSELRQQCQHSPVW